MTLMKDDSVEFLRLRPDETRNKWEHSKMKKKRLRDLCCQNE